MGAMDKLVSFCVAGFFIFSIVYMGFYFKKNREMGGDVLKQVDVATCPSLAAALRGELIGIAKNSGCGMERVLEFRLRAAWTEMLRQGKATNEEKDAVVNFENALENLSDAMEKIGRIPEFRKRIRL